MDKQAKAAAEFARKWEGYRDQDESKRPRDIFQATSSVPMHAYHGVPTLMELDEKHGLPAMPWAALQERP